MATERSKVRFDDVKLVANGHILEVYRYEKAVMSNFEGRGGRRKKSDKESEKSDEHRQHSSRKARNEVRRQVLANFNEHSKFITLTFRDGAVKDVTDVQECNKEFKKFIQRLRYKYKDFKYLAVIEFQDKNGRGAVHYHMISDLPYIENKVLADIWKNGFVRINDISHVDNVGAYMVKYMLKDMNDERLKGNKAYLSSKGLAKSSVIRGNIVDKLVLEQYGITEDTKKAFESSYTSEHHGEVQYVEYNLKRLT